MDIIEFDKKVKVHADYVALRLLDEQRDLDMDGILVSNKEFANNRLAFYVIEDIGPIGAEDYGLKAGDYVLADKLATFYHSAPVSVMQYKNIIVKTNADRSEYFPLRNQVFVKDDEDKTFSLDGIIIASYKKKINTGKVVKMNIDSSISVPYGIGDTVMLVKGGDNILFGTERIHVFKYDQIICKIIDP